MRRPASALLVSGVFVCLLFTASASAEQRPADTMRMLQKLQDNIALGDTAAEAAHAKMLGHVAHQFVTAKPDVWSEPRNARALVTYLFSGGRADLVAQAIPESAVAPELRTLYAGALAYGRGDDAQARDRLMGIDPKPLPNSLGGRLALVQAILSSEEEKAKAIALLDLARLRAPGTLVEEAALRKEISLIGANGDLDKFGLLARRYASAFAQSLYADNYRALLVSIALQIGTTDTREAAARLQRVAATLDRGEQRKLYLTIAREAVLSGRTLIAALAADAAAVLAKGDAREASRAKLYLGAATIVGDQYASGRQALDEAAPSRLDTGDRALLMSAIAVADVIRREPSTVQGIRGDMNRSAIFDSGEQVIARADASLKRADR